MSETGFYSIITDDSFMYVSNTFRNTVSRISKSGTIIPEFIIVDKPISLALSNTTLFVQSLNFIHIYRLDATYNALNVISLPFESSDIYPSMVYKRNDNLLYISNYSKGTITSMNSLGVFNTVYTGLEGISGLCVVSNTLYISNYIENTISYGLQGFVQPYISIPKPRGLFYKSEKFYICYGTKETTYGIGVNDIGTTTYRNIFTAYLSGSIPTTVIYLDKSVYYTLDKLNTIYKDNAVFVNALFDNIQVYNNTGITQSVISTNINCLSNPAYNGLLKLRTIGSNPTNPIIPITTLVGRASGNAIPFNIGIGSSYDSYKMRRKAEILKYRNSTNTPGVTLTNKQLFSQIVKYGGASKFSKARLTQILKENNGTLPCEIGINNGNPITLTPPTNSGIHDSKFEGYYLNPYIPFYTSL